MQSVSSRIWTRVAVSNSYDDNHYTTVTSSIIIINIILLLECFWHQHQLMVFCRSLSDNKSSHVFRTLLSILVDLNHVFVWMVSTHVLIFNSSCPILYPLVTALSAPITYYHDHCYLDFSFSVSYIPFPVFYSRPKMREGSDYMYSIFMFFGCFLFNYYYYYYCFKNINQLLLLLLLLLLLFLESFFPSALADDLSLEFLWQQVQSSLQNSSQYSNRSQ